MKLGRLRIIKRHGDHINQEGRPGQVGGSSPGYGHIIGAVTGLADESTDTESDINFGFEDRSGRLINQFELIDDEISQLPFEIAWVVTKDGNIVFTTTQSNSDQIEFSDTQLAIAKDKIVIHNHPGGESFSRSDIILSIRYGISEIHAYSENVRHYMKFNHDALDDIDVREFSPMFGVGHKSLQQAKFLDEMISTYREVRWDFRKQIDKGEMTIAGAEDLNNDEVWNRMQAKFPDVVDYRREFRVNADLRREERHADNN